MGYDTYYELECFTYPNLEGVSLEVTEKLQAYMDNHKYDLGFPINLLELGEEDRWYDHDVGMLEISREFPDILFKLHGEGEENVDLWRTYYLNGKLQHAPARITYDDFSPELLR